MSDKDASIHIVAYDSKWPTLFATEQELLNHALNRWLKGPIEHIGSTAVPGLAAKPVIDIMAAIGSLEESIGAISALRSLDYLYAPYREDVMHWFCKPDPSFRTHHLHLVPYDSALWTAQIAFRDRLRGDPDIAAHYSELKRSLAASFEHDRERYTAGKTEFVTRVVSESLEKKKSSHPVQRTLGKR